MLQSDALAFPFLYIVDYIIHLLLCLLWLPRAAMLTNACWLLKPVLPACEVVHLFVLQLVLNTFAVGGVADKRQYRTDAFNEQCTLLELSIVQSDLASESILTSNEMITS